MYKLLKGLEPANHSEANQAGARDVAKAVFWSFFGIRRMRALKQDAATLTPLQLIAGGLIGAALFVLGLITLVRFLTA